ncbi:MAG: hypothetical protein K2X08_00300, partial [Chlamydiales bacterium]|nr:hypothetical protein [Chlamydiales bacterium]
KVLREKDAAKAAKSQRKLARRAKHNRNVKGDTPQNTENAPLSQDPQSSREEAKIIRQIIEAPRQQKNQRSLSASEVKPAEVEPVELPETRGQFYAQAQKNLKQISTYLVGFSQRVDLVGKNEENFTEELRINFLALQADIASFFGKIDRTKEALEKFKEQSSSPLSAQQRQWKITTFEKLISEITDFIRERDFELTKFAEAANAAKQPEEQQSMLSALGSFFWG